MSKAFTEYTLWLNKFRKHGRYKSLYEALCMMGIRVGELMGTTRRKMDKGLITENEGSTQLMDSISIAVHSYVDYQVDLGKAYHIFIQDEQFAHWLVDCVKRSPKPETMLPLEHMMVDKATGKPIDIGVVHFPSSSGIPAASFMLRRGFMNNSFLRKIETMGYRVSPYDLTLFRCDGTKSASAMIDLGWSDAGNEFLASVDPTAVLAWHVKLICGLALYVSAFPDAVIHGPPEGLQHPSHFQGNTLGTINVVPEVLQDTAHGTHASPIAHYRDGHFRTLRSSRFVNKQFQTIFVHGTFVKGQAITVLSPEEQQEQQGSTG